MNWEERNAAFKNLLGAELVHDPAAARAFGAKLRQQRETQQSQGYYGQNRTRIGMSQITMLAPEHITAIEEGDYERLPGGLYTQNFVKIYARSLGFSGDETRLIFVNPSTTSVQATPRYFKVDIKKSQVNGTTQAPVYYHPPRFAEYLLYIFISRAERIYLLGDLSEDYEEILSKFGKRRADLWFYKQTVLSLRPLVGRAISSLRFIGWVVEIIRHVSNHQ
jgi:hypothetical protein